MGSRPRGQPGLQGGAPREQTASAPTAAPFDARRAVLANASYGRPAVKAEVQRLGGVELVLSQCQMDRESPLAREWALWGVRNLCEGNEAAQVRSLQAAFLKGRVRSRTETKITLLA